MLSGEEQIFWMKEALERAKRAKATDEVPVGALLIHQGEIIGEAHNHRATRLRTLAHAEILAIEDFNQKFSEWRLKTNSLLVVTVEPCLMCVGALLWARVDHLFYGCRDPRNAGIERIRTLIDEGIYDHRFKTIEGGILSQDCGTLLTEYFSKKRKK